VYVGRARALVVLDPVLTLESMRYVKLAIRIGLYLRPSVVHANCTSDRMLLALLWQEKELAGARARRRYATTELLQ